MTRQALKDLSRPVLGLFGGRSGEIVLGIFFF